MLFKARRAIFHFRQRWMSFQYVDLVDQLLDRKQPLLHNARCLSFGPLSRNLPREFPLVSRLFLVTDCLTRIPKEEDHWNHFLRTNKLSPSIFIGSATWTILSPKERWPLPLAQLFSQARCFSGLIYETRCRQWFLLPAALWIKLSEFLKLRQ